MAKLEGIIYKAFDNYVVLRGFAEIADLAAISKSSKSYQRVANERHKRNIINFLKEGRYVYFPDVILACRAENYSQFRAKVGSDDDVDFTDATFVEGLYVMREYLPVKGHRARHASIEIGYDKKLYRIDGNHRLEPFDESIEWWYELLDIPEEVANEPDEVKKKGWLDHSAKTYKKKIGSIIVPYTIVFTDVTSAEDFEAGIFHNINFRHLLLKEEASLRIISERKTFDIPSLGEEYVLAAELIKRAQMGFFRGITLLTPKENETNNIYRTSCLRIAQLICDLRANDEDIDTRYNSEGFIDEIEEIIQSLRPIYKNWGDYAENLDSLAIEEIMKKLYYFEENFEDLIEKIN